MTICPEENLERREKIVNDSQTRKNNKKAEPILAPLFSVKVTYFTSTSAPASVSFLEISSACLLYTSSLEQPAKEQTITAAKIADKILFIWFVTSLYSFADVGKHTPF